jgi:hypothetical protein
MDDKKKRKWILFSPRTGSSLKFDSHKSKKEWLSEFSFRLRVRRIVVPVMIGTILLGILWELFIKPYFF